MNVFKKITRMISILAILGLSIDLFTQSEIYAQQPNPKKADFTTKKVAQAGFTFLEIGVGARIEGMGAIGSVLTNDPVLIFWNPASIGKMESKYAFYAGLTPWFADIKHQSAALTYNMGNLGVVGLSIINMDYGTVYETEIAGEDIKGFREIGALSSIGNTMIGLTYARSITDRLSLGGTVKYVKESIGPRFSASVIAFDLGTNYDTGFKGTKIAMSFMHAGKRHTYIEEPTDLPILFRIAVMTDFGQLLNLNLPQGHNWIVGVEGNNPRDYTERVHIGTEYILANLISLRGGYKVNYDYENITLGFGVQLKGIRVDYAFNNFQEPLGTINRISLNAAF